MLSVMFSGLWEVPTTGERGDCKESVGGWIVCVVGRGGEAMSYGYEGAQGLDRWHMVDYTGL